MEADEGIPSRLRRLERAALDDVATYHESLARRLRARAARDAAADRARRDAAARLDHLASIGPMVASWIAEGYPVRAAVLKAAAVYRVPVETVEAHWTRHRRRLDRLARTMRDRKIITLYWRGKSNAMIAARTGVSIATVKRVIRDARLRCPPTVDTTSR